MANQPWVRGAQYPAQHAYLSGRLVHALANPFHQSVMCMYQADSLHRVGAVIAKNSQ